MSFRIVGGILEKDSTNIFLVSFMASDNPRFTILIPVVKTRYFQEAIESALAQNFQDYEIVVVDNKADGDLSTWAEKPRVRLFHNETQLAPAPNWNKGIEHSRGDYIVLLCDDDILAPECLAELDAFLKGRGEGLDVVRFLRKEFGREKLAIAYSCPGKELETVDEYVYFQFRFFRGQALSDFAFSRKSALEIGGFPSMPGCLASDKSFVIRLASRQNKIGNLNLPLLNYRWHGMNYTNVRRPGLYEDSLDSDFFLYNLVNQLLEKSSGDCRGLALAENRRHWQVRQNSHFNDALRSFGWRGLIRIWRHAPDSPASKTKSFWLAVANKARRFLKRKK